MVSMQQAGLKLVQHGTVQMTQESLRSHSGLVATGLTAAVLGHIRQLQHGNVIQRAGGIRIPMAGILQTAGR